MKRLTHEQLLSAMSYDRETGLFAKHGHPPQAGNSDKRGYLMVSVNGYPYRAHRLAWFYVNGEWPDGQIDHINCVKHDNRIENLRICTRQQNNHNQPLRKTNTSGVKGVYWSKRQRKWRGQVCINYRIHHTGGFEDIADAQKAVIVLREKLHGDFANHG